MFLYLLDRLKNENQCSITDYVSSILAILYLDIDISNNLNLDENVIEKCLQNLRLKKNQIFSQIENKKSSQNVKKNLESYTNKLV